MRTAIIVTLLFLFFPLESLAKEYQVKLSCRQTGTGSNARWDMDGSSNSTPNWDTSIKTAIGLMKTIYSPADPSSTPVYISVAYRDSSRQSELILVTYISHDLSYYYGTVNILTAQEYADANDDDEDTCPDCGQPEDECDCDDEDTCPDCGNPEDECTCEDCGACCACKCEGGDCTGHDPCGGTYRDCSCHEREECEHCCYCKCDCEDKHEIWGENICSGHCGHKCEQPDFCSGIHCECHHEGDGECCEHHKKDFKRPPDIVIQDPGAFNDADFSSPTPPPFTPNLPGWGNGLELPTPHPFELPEVRSSDPPPEVEKQPLQYFERDENGGLPEFKYDELFDELMEIVKQKIPLGWADQLKGGGGGSGDIDLSWTVQFSLWDQSYGPWKFDMREYINEYVGYPISNIFRKIVLFVMCVFFIIVVLSLFFETK